MQADDVTSAHQALGRHAWAEAHALFARADDAGALGPADLERMAVAAYMAGRDDDGLDAPDRAHRAHLAAGDRPAAARVAVWLGIHLILRGETGRATGWHARARRLVEAEGRDCVARGYVASADALRHMGARDWAATREASLTAVAVGERFGDPDLVALGLSDLGRALVEEGRADEGLERLDEAMVAALAGELSPVVTGF